MKQILVDCGPLVAFFGRRDRWHKWAWEQMAALPAPLLTCEPVLTEACFLLRRAAGDPLVILQAVRQGTLQVAIRVAAEAAAIEKLMDRYSDVPMSLADACLVRMSELHPDCRVFTVDSDFAHYRRHGREVIPLLAPWRTGS